MKTTLFPSLSVLKKAQSGLRLNEMLNYTFYISNFTVSVALKVPYLFSPFYAKSYVAVDLGTFRMILVISSKS